MRRPPAHAVLCVSAHLVYDAESEVGRQSFRPGVRRQESTLMTRARPLLTLSAVLVVLLVCLLSNPPRSAGHQGKGGSHGNRGHHGNPHDGGGTPGIGNGPHGNGPHGGGQGSGNSGANAVDCEAERCDLQPDLTAACPCQGQNHGQYVGCVRRFMHGHGATQCRGAIMRCAARSTCGKENAVTCDLPGGCAIKRSAQACTNAGGTARASATCCEACGPTSPSGAFLD